MSVEQEFGWAPRILEAQFGGLIDAAPDAIIVTDERGRILISNRQAEQVFGYARQELKGKLIEILVPARFQDVHVHHRAEFQSHPRCRPMGSGREVLGLRKDGSEFSAECSLSPFEVPGLGRLVIAIVRDVSERRQLMAEIERRKAELWKAQELAELQNNILSNLSHELKTPLSLILGNAELLQDRFPGEPLVVDLQEGVRRISEHITDLLDFVALMSHRASLYKTEVCLREVLDIVALHSRHCLEAKGLVLEISVDSAATSIIADSRRVTQMVQALLDNACRASPQGGRISIDVEPEDGYVRISVQDAGPGIAPGVQATIWSPFGQIESSSTERQGGLGLGLSIVKRLAELHDGWASLESAPGHGSRFSIFLPLKTHDPPEDSASDASS